VNRFSVSSLSVLFLSLYESTTAALSFPRSLYFLEAVYLNETLPLNTRLRAATEAAKYRHAKLTAIANVSEGSLVQMLDAAIERSKPKLIELQPEPALEPVNAPEQHPASELRKPMAKLRRY